MEDLESIFNGNWSSAIVPNGNSTPDGTFNIVIDPMTKKLEPKSTHDGRPITGEVTRGTRFHAIVINEDSPRKRYLGSVVVEGSTLTLSGFRDLNPTGFVSEENAGRAEKTDEFFDQLQEVWVATKP